MIYTMSLKSGIKWTASQIPQQEWLQSKVYTQTNKLELREKNTY